MGQAPYDDLEDEENTKSIIGSLQEVSSAIYSILCIPFEPSKRMVLLISTMTRGQCGHHAL